MPSPPEPPPSAPGERTALAWERSALSYASLAALVLGVAAHRGLAWLVAVSAALVAVAAGVWHHGHHAYDRSGVVAQPRALRLIALATALVAVAATVVVLVPS